MRLLIILALIAAAVGGCETFDPVEYEEQIVVEGYLVMGEPLPPLRLTRSAPIGQRFDVEEQALSGATVFVHRLDEEGNVERVFRYSESERQAGLYRPVNGEAVRPLTRYRLEASLPDGRGDLVTETLVPGGFELIDASADTLVYQSDAQLVLTVSPTSYPGRQSVYILTSESFEPTFENLTPVYRALVAEGNLTEADLRVGSSPLLNEANYERGANSEIIIRLPWLAVPFYGRSRINLNVIDDNLFDFLRSQAVQQGGGTLAPGEIPNVLDRVDGGTGVFGSFSRVSHEIVVVR